MSYFGGPSVGYEAGLLSVGIAYTEDNPTLPHEWQRLDNPVLMATDKDAAWWDNITIYKNSIVRDPERLTGYDFLMYYLCLLVRFGELDRLDRRRPCKTLRRL